MLNEVPVSGTCHRIAKRAFEQYPEVFTQPSRKAALEKARMWCANSEELLSSLESSENEALHLTSSKSTGTAVRRVYLKARRGIGRKRPESSDNLHSLLLDEFRRLRAIVIKVDYELLRIWALHILQDDEFNVTEREVTAVTCKEPIDVINRIWVKSFAQRFNIIVRCRTGKSSLMSNKCCSPVEKWLII